MTSRADDQRIYEFASFRLDPTERLLLRDDKPVPLTPKAFDLLIYLVERHGRLIEKQALMVALWPDTVVEEANLAYNIWALRKVLDEGAEGPSMIQTVPTRGYRFVTAVSCSSPPAAVAENVGAREHVAQETGSFWRERRTKLVFAFIGLCAAAAAAVLWASRARRLAPRPAVTEPALVRLTANPAEMSLTSARISPDGRFLSYADPSGVQVRLIDTGETHHLPDTKGMNVYGWSPDSASVLASRCGDTSCSGWDISLIGQERRRTGAVWSVHERVTLAPNGSGLLRLTDSGALSMDRVNGGRVRLGDGFINAANWSADGKRVLFVREGSAIDSVPAEGGTAAEVFRAPTDQVIVDVVELPDESIFAAISPPGTARSTAGMEVVEIWKLQRRGTDLVRTTPRRLTWGADRVSGLSASNSGERLAFLSTSYQEDVYVADADLPNGRISPPRRFTLEDRNDVPFAWTPDSSTVIFVSTRNGNADIFTQRLESDSAEPFVIGPRNQNIPRVTSDGRWVLFCDSRAEDRRIMRVPLTGGTPELLASGSGGFECAAHGRCVRYRARDGITHLLALDPLQGEGAELGRIPETEGSTILPDGDAFAYIVPQDNGPRNRVRLISFRKKPNKDILVEHATALMGLDWLPSDSGFLTTDDGNLLLVSPNGSSRVLWSPAPLRAWWALASPDEKHLAISVSSQQSNAWLLTGF
jgi:DNA-binding winged helix-turn-helix (wHTH) protein